ncbi:probable LRR receptor-like serine/threonine-protein kinase At1g67720 [Typha angustifolia]|uniref:probable LRR receptor-like serine/threonine-protein kinase At1g67720 n=1 Tax=Typha angustifolia TaxID=59011 RepID=UPI003C2E11B3
MPISISFYLLLILILLTIFPSFLHASIPLPRGYYINCGCDKEDQFGSIRWIQDEGFIDVGNVSTIDNPNILPILSTLRYFPDESARKYCYVFPVIKEAKYLIRTTYFYGGFDGGKEPPVFDQIIEGTKWSSVNTSENYAKGLTSYYEIVVAAQGKTLSVCLARNKDTVSSPFISALELVSLEDSMYNSTDFTKYALSTIARHSFGYDGNIISYPDDQFNRYWSSFMDANLIVGSHSNVSSTNFWNFPPQKALRSALTASRGKQLVVQWPAVALPNDSYYVALYFQDNRTPSPFSWRVFDVAVNGKDFYKGLNVSADGVMVYASQLQLAGETQITLTPDEDSPVGPVINAGEIFQIVPLGGKTITRDVIAMNELARSIKNPPSDWSGDPCLPLQNSWTGIICSNDFRVESLNFTNYGLSGSLPDDIVNLTALTNIWLGGNKLSGPIPDVRNLKKLVTLHLNDNEFSGMIPPSLGELNNLKELYLYNNNLTGQIPESLRSKPGLDMQTYGNRLE